MSIKSLFLYIRDRFLRWGLLHESHRPIEKASGYILFGSLCIALILLVLGMVSRFLLGGLFEGVFMTGLKISFFSFWVGAAMLVLSTNDII
jgi:hypothetical protein